MQIRTLIHILIILVFSYTLIISLPAQAASNTVLGSKPTQTYPLSKLPRWQEILSSNTSDIYNAKSDNVKAWKKFIRSIQNDPELRQLLKVNMWFKRFPYKQDNWIYGEDDYWATPVEFLTKGGDCEDYAIIKYMTLRKLGFPAKDMKIAIVYDVYSGTDHAFLTVKYKGAEFVLDTREKLVVARYMKNRYKPHFAFNERHVWTYNSPVIAQKIRKGTNNAIIPGNR